MDNRKTSQARINASNKYRKKTYDNLSVAIPKGKREYYKAAAEKLGYSSINQFIISAMDEKIERGV